LLVLVGVFPNFPQPERRRPPNRQSVQGSGLGGGRLGRQERPLLRARADQRSIANANRVQDAVAVLAENIHLVSFFRISISERQ
jgi:hypothetical protein